MIERDGKEITFICDVCDESETEEGDFYDIWEELKSDGWRAFMNEDGDWEHRCPDCVGA